MTVATIDDPVLTRFSQEIRQAYGARLERLVLFGSRARGDFRPDSDYDVAVFIYQPESFDREASRLAKVGTDLLYDMGVAINALHFPAGAYRERTGFMAEVRLDGIDL